MNLTLATQQKFNSILCDFWTNEENEVFMTREQIGQALEYADPRRSVSKVHERNSERMNKFSTVVKLTTQAGLRETTIYNEHGIYEIARRSEQPKADDFYDFVYELLSKLRKGEAKLVQPQPDYVLPTNFREALYMLAETVGERDELQEVVENNKEKVVLANAITSSDEGLLIEAAAKYMRQNGVNIGRDRLFEWLRGQKYLISRKGREWNMPTQKAIEQGLMKVHNSLYYDSEGELKTNRQVVVTGKGLLFFVNKFLHDGQLKLEV